MIQIINEHYPKELRARILFLKGKIASLWGQYADAGRIRIANNLVPRGLQIVIREAQLLVKED